MKYMIVFALEFRAYFWTIHDAVLQIGLPPPIGSIVIVFALIRVSATFLLLSAFHRLKLSKELSDALPVAGSVAGPSAACPLMAMLPLELIYENIFPTQISIINTNCAQHPLLMSYNLPDAFIQPL